MNKIMDFGKTELGVPGTKKWACPENEQPIL